MTKYLLLGFLLCVSGGLAGCGDLLSASNSSGASGLLEIFWPSADISDSEDGYVDNMDAGDGMLGSGKWDNRFYLNFSGATLAASDSFIIDKAGKTSVTIPAFAGSGLGSSYSDSDTATLKTTIKEGIENAFDGINVELFTEEPEEQPYSTVYIGGTNFTTTDNVLGVAPLDFNNFSSQDVIFVFSEEFADQSGETTVDILTNVAAHEIAHSIGARHIESDDATLNPVVRADTDDFDVSGDVVGEDEEENTKELLLWTVGSDEEATSDDLPTIVDLAMVSDDDVGQLSIFSSANAQANPGVDFNDFDYTWTFEGNTATGPTVRILFEGELGATFNVQLTITAEGGETVSYDFKINKN